MFEKTAPNFNTSEMGFNLVLRGRFLVHLNQRETARLSVRVSASEGRKNFQKTFKKLQKLKKTYDRHCLNRPNRVTRLNRGEPADTNRLNRLNRLKPLNRNRPNRTPNVTRHEPA